MAAPFDDATTLLTAGVNAVRTFYRDQYPKMYATFSKINKIFKPGDRRIDGNGMVIQVEAAGLYGARMNSDINADFPIPRAPRPDFYTATLSEVSSSNDFRRMALSLQVTWLDIERVLNKRASATDWIQNLLSDSTTNIDSSLALHRYLGTSAKVATINGTPKKNDARFVADCAAISTTGGARFAIDGGSIAALPMGLELDVYNSTTYKGTVWITDYNPSDDSIGVYGVTGGVRGGAPDSTVDVSGILADNYDLYISAEYGNGLKSLQSWFEEPASGESFFGRDRTSPLYRWMIPHTSGPSSSRQFVKTDLDNAAIESGYIDEDPDKAYVMLATPRMVQRYKNEIGNDVLIQFPSTEQQGKLIAQYGFDGVLYRHEMLGRISFQSDPLHPPNEIKLLRLGDWEDLHPGSGTFEWLPGSGGDSYWYRMPSTTPGAGNTTTYRMDGLMAVCSICTFPRRNIRIRNVSPT